MTTILLTSWAVARALILVTNIGIYFCLEKYTISTIELQRRGFKSMIVDLGASALRMGS